MRYEPISPISFLYQPERGPKREYQNIVTLFKRCRITVVIRSFGTLAKNPLTYFCYYHRHHYCYFFVREKA